MPPTKERPLKFGYNGLYTRLIEVITGRGRLVMSSLMVYMTGLAVIFFIILNPFSPQKFDIQIEFIKIIRLFTYTLSFLFGSAVVVSIFQIMRSVFSFYENKLAFLVSMILIRYPNPYSRKSGQSFRATAKLQEIAAIEQAGSDWRGSILSIISWASLIGLAIWFWDIAQHPDVIFSALSVQLESFSTETYQILIGIAGFTTILLLYSFVPWVFLIDMLTLYYSTESANRLLLKACVEACSILEFLSLDKKNQINLTDKKRIAKFLECEIVNDILLDRSHFEFAEQFIHNNRQYWIIKRRPIKKRVNPFVVIKSNIQGKALQIKSRIFKSK